MQTKRAILLAVTSVGILGVLGAAIAGQAAFNVPEPVAATTNKSITLNVDDTVSPFADPAKYFNYAIAEKTDGSASENHDRIGLKDQAIQGGISSHHFNYEGGLFYVNCDASGLISRLTIGLNNITSFSLDLYCGLTTDYLTIYMMNEAKELVGEMVALHDAEHYDYDLPTPYAGGDAQYLAINYFHVADGQGASFFKVASLNVDWSC